MENTSPLAMTGGDPEKSGADHLGAAGEDIFGARRANQDTSLNLFFSSSGKKSRGHQGAAAKTGGKSRMHASQQTTAKGAGKDDPGARRRV